MLCQSCQKIFYCERDVGASGKILKSISYPVSLRLIQASGHNGCGLCAQLHHKLKTWERNGGDRYQLQYQLSEQLEYTDRFSLSFKFTPTSTKSQLSPESAAIELSDLSSHFTFQILTPESTDAVR
jgi:hypothetical protein